MTKIEAAELRSRRDRDRLKGNGETESFKRTELATNRQKNKIVTTTHIGGWGWGVQRQRRRRRRRRRTGVSEGRKGRVGG